MRAAGANRRDSRYLLHVFVYGSLLVLLACLCTTAIVFSATYLKKERQRAEISMDQLSHFFNYQYRPVTEEMWTRNYEAINLRIGNISKQLGRAAYRLVLADDRGKCVYASVNSTAAQDCELPRLMQEQLPLVQPGPPRPTLRFDDASGQYVYMVPLYVGAVKKGFLYAAISDPYEFYRGYSLALALKIFIVPIACVILAWLIWLVASQRFILRPYLSSLVELERKQAVGELAAQVAHDIRSPLVTMNSVVRSLKGLSEKQRRLLIASSSRIENIANDLITHFISANSPETESFAFLASVVDSIVAEKIAMLGPNSSIEVRADLPSELCHVGVPVSATELSRVLSNLINNGVEAARENKNGLVRIFATASDGWVTVGVEDNGKGMSDDLLHKVRTIGGSHGRGGGAGIGLSHAKAAIAKVGGTITIDSVLGEGTAVRVELPQTDLPKWCARQIDLSDAEQVVVLDDDESVHLLWKQRLGEDRIVYLTDPEQFDVARFPPQTSRYIFDHEIGGSPVTGLDLIVSHKLADRAVLVTSYSNEPKIQRAVELAGAKILPKFMMSKVDIRKRQISRAFENDLSESAFDLVLIDDDPLVHDLWEFEASQNGLRLLTLHHPQALSEHGVGIGTPVFVDKNLSNGLSGLVVAGSLHEKGFRNIYVTTGDNLDQRTLPAYIRGVIGKGFPDQVVHRA